jgi:hypothetical protein
MKSRSAEVLLAYPSLKKPGKPSTLRATRIRLRKEKVAIDQILAKLEATRSFDPLDSVRRLAPAHVPHTGSIA